jgi:diguanylate cyclase (GGDEF)-like protein/PAS domain S-box-containing protein
MNPTPSLTLAHALGLIEQPACACATDGQILAANPAMARLLGKSHLDQHNLLDFFSPAWRAGAIDQLRRAHLARHALPPWHSTMHGPHGEMTVQIYLKAVAEPQAITLVFNDISAYHQDEVALRRTLLEQQAILENAAVGILFSKAGLISECNIRTAEMFGYSRNQLIGQNSEMLFPDRERCQQLRDASSPLLKAGHAYRSEVQLKHQDDTLFWCRVYGKAIDPWHTDGGTIWIMEDIGEIRSAQQLLQQTLLEVEAIMTNASVGISFTKNRKITRYNRRFGELFGFVGDSGLNLPGSAVYPSQEAYEELGRQAGPLLSSGKPFQTETLMRRQDNSTLWAQLIGYVVNPKAPAEGTIWIIEDRTEHKQAEQALRNALLENQAILESAVIGIAVVERGYNLRCNRKMEELFGYAPGEIAGVSVQSFYRDLGQWDASRQATARDFLAGRVHSAEQLLVRKDGQPFWARLTGRPFDPSQPQGRSVWLVDDITASREAAQAVLRARDDLELRVMARTAELAGANAKLQAEIIERRQAEARVHHLAYHDSLTGLPNRSLLTDRLQEAIHAARAHERHLAVLFIDLDRFKTINDSLGHMVGDQLLQEVGKRISHAVRASDTVSRLGGDEFVVLAPELPHGAEAGHIAQKIIEVLDAPFHIENRQLHITPSIGICLCPDDGTDVDTLMRHADTAMYQAKANGRNTYQFFTAQMNLAASHQFEIDNALRGALARGEFELYYQPIMDITTRRLEGLEVLLRWQRPGHGLVAPDQFIPIVEENGLIVPLGEWVIRQACLQCMEWQQQGLPVVPLAINLSPRQFMERNLTDSIQAILQETGMPPHLLEFEITETALMGHGEQTLEILRQINQMGIRLSIDDFGTGYSSLAYLKRFPVKKLKIDRAFIKDLEHSSDDQVIVAAIIALSNSLQLLVVAEGVETEAQYALLQQNGADFAQGFLFSRPVPATQAMQFLMQASAIDHPTIAG